PRTDDGLRFIRTDTTSSPIYGDLWMMMTHTNYRYDAFAMSYDPELDDFIISRDERI
ncbi:23115_t:CDS:1, partial [Racocetra persica]